MYTSNEPAPDLTADPLDRAIWRKSSHSGTQGNCVEVATNALAVVAVRDSKNPDSAFLVVSRTAWSAFITGLQMSTPGHSE